MRQNLILAAIAMAFSLGVRQNAWALTDKVGCTEQNLKDELNQYVEPATEMFEVAEEMAMEKPANAANAFYEGCGSWFSSYCKANKKFPERAEMLAGMADGLKKVFNDTLSHTQRDALAIRLAEFE